MRQSRNDPGDYVRRVQEGNQRLAQDLLCEVARLQVLVAALEAEKEELSDRTSEIHEMIRANQALRALAASLEAERNRLHEQVFSMRADNERQEKEQARLQAQLESTKAESHRFSARFSEIEQQNSNLANLYVASYRLHGTLDRKEVIDTLQEILANLIGCEEAALFELDPRKQTLELVASFGISPDACRSLPLGNGPIGQAARSGEVYVANPAEAPPKSGVGLDDRLTACIPLTLDGQVTGAIAIFRLLPQKARIEDVDRELFGLLATHAATALYCTTLHAKRTAGSAGR